MDIELTRKQVGLGAVVVFLPFLLHLLGVDWLMTINVALIAVLVCVCVKDIRKNIFFFFFLASFFVFLMSGDIAESIFHQYYWIRFGEEETRHSRIAIMICLVFMLIGFLTTKTKSAPVRKLGESGTDRKIYEIQTASKVIYYITYSVMLFNTLDVVLYVARYGYVEYYLSYTPSLPAIIAKIGSLCGISLCIFLATMPSSKSARIPMILYAMNTVLGLLKGSRGSLVYSSVFLLGYLIYRNGTDKGKDVWIKKSVLILMCISVPFFLAFLFIWEYIRSDIDFTFTSIGDYIVKFFVNIGSSSQVIKTGYKYREQIPNFRFFSLGTVLNYFKFGRIFNLFNLSAIPAAHSAEFALEGYSFENYLTYIVNPSDYLAGHGIGGSFIAPLYADFGYIGIALGSFIYGWLFKKISELNPSSWLTSGMKLYIIATLLKAPRGPFDGFLADIINLDFWITVFMIAFIALKFVDSQKYSSGTAAARKPKAGT